MKQCAEMARDGPKYHPQNNKQNSRKLSYRVYPKDELYIQKVNAHAIG